MSAHIRRAVTADAEAVTGCVAAAYRHYIPRIGKPPGPMLADYAAVIAQHPVWVAEIDGTVAALLVLVQRQSSMLLDNVAVHPAYQGRGLGHQLITLAEDEARRQGHTDIQLYTHEKMTENIAMYRKLGYREVERRIEAGYRRVYLSKQLSQRHQQANR